MAPPRSLACLALSGGGALTRYTTEVLSGLQSFRDTAFPASDPDRPLVEAFDVLAGTSAGALVAGGLALGRSPAELSQVLEHYGPKIFAPSRGLSWRWLVTAAGLRDFNGSGGLEYVSGLARVNIDFDGFSGNCTPTRCADAVRGEISGRQVFDLDGNNITGSIVTAINTEENAALTALPVLRFRIGTGVLDANGEIRGTLDSNFGNLDGRSITYEEGNYYAIMAGDHTTAPGGEIVGIIVVEGQDRRAPGTTFRETGGFIVERGAPTP